MVIYQPLYTQVLGMFRIRFKKFCLEGVIIYTFLQRSAEFSNIHLSQRCQFHLLIRQVVLINVSMKLGFERRFHDLNVCHSLNMSVEHRAFSLKLHVCVLKDSIDQQH